MRDEAIEHEGNNWAAEVENATQTLQKIYRGMLNGENWKQGLGKHASWEKVCEQVDSAIWGSGNRGIQKKICQAKTPWKQVQSESRVLQRSCPKFEMV